MGFFFQADKCHCQSMHKKFQVSNIFTLYGKITASYSMNKNQSHINGVQGNSFFVQFSFIILGQVVLSSISCWWGINDAQHFLKGYPTWILSCGPGEGFRWPMWMHETDQDVSIIIRCFHDRSKPPLPVIHTSEVFSWTNSVADAEVDVFHTWAVKEVSSPDILVTCRVFSAFGM